MGTTSGDVYTLLLGTAKSDSGAAETLGVSLDDLNELCADANIEICPGCEWWVESGEIASNIEEGRGDTCDDCV